MKLATIRDLRNEFSRVTRWIEEGECLEITHSGKLFAQLAPISAPAVRRVEMPDFLALIRENFPNEKPGKGLSSVVDYDRGDQ